MDKRPEIILHLVAFSMIFSLAQWFFLFLSILSAQQVGPPDEDHSLPPETAKQNLQFVVRKKSSHRIFLPVLNLDIFNFQVCFVCFRCFVCLYVWGANRHETLRKGSFELRDLAAWQDFSELRWDALWMETSKLTTEKGRWKSERKTWSWMSSSVLPCFACTKLGARTDRTSGTRREPGSVQQQDCQAFYGPSTQNIIINSIKYIKCITLKTFALQVHLSTSSCILVVFAAAFHFGGFLL